MNTDNTQQEHHFAHHFRDEVHEYDSGKEGLWIFMVTEILMFGGLFVAYIIFHALYPEMFAEGAKQTNWVMGFINTLVLITSSLTMALSIYYVQKSQRQKATWMLASTILCGAIFLMIKYFEYEHKIHLGYLPGKMLDVAAVHPQHSNLGLYFGLYFVMTGLHGTHVLIGMGLITWLLIRNIRGDFTPSYYLPLEGVGIFWHIVDLIWIFLFPLLYLIG